MGDWGDFIDREEAREKKAKDSKSKDTEAGSKNDSGKYNKDKNRDNNGARPLGSGDAEGDASGGQKEKGSDKDRDGFLNSEFDYTNYRVDDKDKQFRQTNAVSQDPGASQHADDIRDNAKNDIYDIAQEQEPWNIKAEDIAPEHLAMLYNTGVVYKILGVFFSKQIYRSRVKKAREEINSS